ncbi:MAG: hypothetical protein ACYDHA_07780 [Bellilinea sp.]
MPDYLSGDIQNCQVFVKKPDPPGDAIFDKWVLYTVVPEWKKDTILSEKYLFSGNPALRDSLAECAASSRQK